MRQTQTKTQVAPAETHSKIEIRYLPIGSLKSNLSNARIHTGKQIRQIADSIATFGLNSPILVDPTGKVIAGHGRLQACKLLGYSEIPVILVSHLTEHQKMAFALADNKLADNSRWDERLLREQLQILAEAEIDFNLEAIGFDASEIEMIVEPIGSSGSQSMDPADAGVETVFSRPVSRRGDVWKLGDHRILCGDAGCEDDYRKLMGEKKASAVFTDPSYHVPNSGHVREKEKSQHPEFVMPSGKVCATEFTKYLTRVCTLLAARSAPGSLHYLCTDWRHMEEVLTAGRSAYAELKNLCVWIKSNGGMASMYHSQHELVFVFGNRRSDGNVESRKLGRSRTDVWNYPGSNSLAQSTKNQNLLAFHPALKPIGLVADAVKDSTVRGDVVLDPFEGSGTTVIAAARVGRICYGMHVNPLYVDVAVRRSLKHVGVTAVNELTGQTFVQCEEADHANERQ